MNGVDVMRNLSMVDPNDIEACAMDDAGALGGAYLEEIKKSDLATMTKEEWQTFVKTICGGYVGSLMDARAKSRTLAWEIERKAENVLVPAKGGKDYRDDEIPF